MDEEKSNIDAVEKNSAASPDNKQDTDNGAPLSSELKRLAAEIGERQVKFRELVQITHGRGYDLLLVVLGLPFLTPIPLPGFSTPFGLAIALAGLRMGFGKKVWYPTKLLEKNIPHSFFPKLLKFATGICKTIEFFAKPRFQFLHNFVLFQRLAGVLILISGLLLALPLPIPFSNTLPAITVVLLASSAMRKDGIIFILGCISFLLCAVFFSLIFFGGIEAIEFLKNRA
ncbi:MAG: exopolysaccharide biosynthesis protein [Verrucomicrobiia bacterium]